VSRVLVVDDSNTMRQILSMALQGVGHDVLEAENGEDALARVEGQPVDLVITDINMPSMDGITLVRRLRERAATKYTPILVLTTEWQEMKRREGKAAGATGWIVKPFEPEKLLSVVKRVLG